jgi:predicted secreted protein
MSGRAALGTTLEYTEPTALVGGLTKIGGVSMTADNQEVTSHDSTGGFKEYIPTLLEPGECQIEGNMLPADAGQVAMLAHYQARTNEPFKITFPDGAGNTPGSTWEFDASISAFAYGDAPVAGVLAFTATLRISGQPVFTPVSGS